MTIDIDAIRNRAYHAANNRHRWASEVGVTDVDVLDGLRRAKQLAVDDVPALLAKVDELAAELDRARADERNTIAADIENMPINLGDTGWKHLEAKADEASYPTEWVRRRRTRDDFTTATIEVAYQYGYRQAAKVARGEVTP